MNRKQLSGLVALNAVLLVLVLALSFSPKPAQAQFGGVRAGNYAMVSVESRARTADAIVIFDLNRGAMLATYYKALGATRGEFELVDGRLIAQDFEGGRDDR